MTHGNKKYNFEDLKKPGDSITVQTANVYSLKNSLRLYCKVEGITYDKKSFNYATVDLDSVKITRLI